VKMGGKRILRLRVPLIMGVRFLKKNLGEVRQGPFALVGKLGRREEARLSSSTEEAAGCKGTPSGLKKKKRKKKTANKPSVAKREGGSQTVF